LSPGTGVLVGRVRAPVIVNGEIVALHAGRPDFGVLQSRMHVRGLAARLTAAIPVQLYVFDLLHAGGRPLLGLPYTERRARLEDLGLDADPVRTPPCYPGDGPSVLAVSRIHGLEGVVGKPLASRYQPGRRRDWIKIKNTRHQELLICGWMPGTGRRADMIGSLVLGGYDGARLRYAGTVGTGFTHAMLADLMGKLAPLERDTSPFSTPAPPRYTCGARWVEPRLAGEVACTERTRYGSLRHPSWRGLRHGTDPGQEHREPG
jgi:bifunctional non-homologous end joining protein LigD